MTISIYFYRSNVTSLAIPTRRCIEHSQMEEKKIKVSYPAVFPRSEGGQIHINLTQSEQCQQSASSTLCQTRAFLHHLPQFNTPTTSSFSFDLQPQTLIPFSRHDVYPSSLTRQDMLNNPLKLNKLFHCLSSTSQIALIVGISVPNLLTSSTYKYNISLLYTIAGLMQLLQIVHFSCKGNLFPHSKSPCSKT